MSNATIVLGTSLLTNLGTNVDKMNNVQELNLIFLLFLSKALAKQTHKSTQVCKTRNCIRTCKGWPNGFELASCKKL